MSYREVAPPPGLEAYVLALWEFTVHPGLGEIEHVIPLTGGLLLSVGQGGELLLVGPRVEPLTTRVRGGNVFRGAHFWPGAASALLHLPPGSLRDALGPAELWLDPAWCRDLSHEVAGDGGLPRLAEALTARIHQAAALDAAVLSAAVRLMRARGDVALADLARAVALSPRQLRRRFQAAAGLSPKELARIWRLRGVAASAAFEDRAWLDRVGDGGYADQPHLVHEFRRLLGVTPSDFERHARRIDHRLVEP